MPWCSARDTGQAYVRASNDQCAILWGKVNGYIPFDPAALVEGSGVWNPQQLIINKPLRRCPAPGRNSRRVLRRGADALRDHRPGRAATSTAGTTWAAGECIEIRLPYQAIGFSDPSSLQALRVSRDGSLTTETVDRVGIT